MPTRRDVLLLGGIGALALMSGCAPSEARETQPDDEVLIPAPEFDGRALPIPPILAPDADGWHSLRAQSGRTELVSGLLTPTWGFNGPVLGPTLRAARGDRVRVRVENGIDETTTVHWHGMILPAEMDGGPHQPIEPGAVWEPEWMVDQPAATLWYHPHPHGATAKHVYRGLAGLFIVDDPQADDGLPSDYGVDDIPVILQDRTLLVDGSLSWRTVPQFGLMGTTMIVNGAHAPTLTATRRSLRLRILAASNARRFNLAFSDDRPFFIVANDAGLLGSPVEARSVSVSPAERIEMVVEIEPGDDVFLETRSGAFDIDEGDHRLLRIAGGADVGPPAWLPSALPAAGRVRRGGPGATHRTFRLNGADAINGQEMSMSRIDAVIPRGAVEVWRVENPVYAHNFHIHGCSFEVLEYEGGNPPIWMAGRKDTVFVPPRSSVLLAVEFADYVDERHPYMYHCHILRHEDEGMMGQFLVVDPTRLDDASRLHEIAGHGH